MARLKQLPTEVQARICEFVGDIADAPSDYQPDPLRQDTFFPELGGPETTAIEPTYSSIYKDLRSLALTSKAFTDSAQRVLFRIAVVGGPRCIMRLLKSLLLYPKNRRYIRSLFVTRKTYSARDHLAEVTPLPFIYELRPLVLTRRIDELHDASFFRGFEAGLSLGEFYHDAGWGNSAYEFPTGFLLNFANHVLRAIIQLCPSLSGFHICYGDNWSPSLGKTEVPASLDDGPSNTFPQLKSLTLDYGALRARVDSIAIRPRYPGGCPPNVERLTLIGNTSKEPRSTPPAPDLNYIHSWIRSNKTLKELRVVNGFDDWLDDAVHNFHNGDIVTPETTWNTILPLFKDTLELLVFDGYTWMPLESGPTRMLSCLEEFGKLAYLKVPLHMLRQDCHNLCVPKRGQNVLDLVQAKLPEGLKKMDIVVVTKKGEVPLGDEILTTKTFQVRL